jgi:ATP-dependent RNA helicase DeaD
MERFRLEVGRAQNIQPKHIVGAIANEAGIDSQHIDNISIQDDYSTVDLPEGMPKDVLRHLQKTWICGQPMRIHRLGEDAPVDSRGADKPRHPRSDKPTTSERPTRSGKLNLGERTARSSRPAQGDKPPRSGKPNFGDKPLRSGKPGKPAHGKPAHGKADKARKPRKP